MELLELSLLMLATVLLSSVIDQLVPKVSSPLIQIGLGLAIAREIVERHGGSIRAETDGRRTSFVIRLPTGGKGT